MNNDVYALPQMCNIHLSANSPSVPAPSEWQLKENHQEDGKVLYTWVLQNRKGTLTLSGLPGDKHVRAFSQSADGALCNSLVFDSNANEILLESLQKSKAERERTALPEDLFTHETAWLNALMEMRDKSEGGEKGDGSYWQHEINVFNRVFEELRLQTHDYYTDADRNRPDSICDRNGQVVLSLCKRCGKAEGQLVERCIPPVKVSASDKALDQILAILQHRKTDDGVAFLNSIFVEQIIRLCQESIVRRHGVHQG